jgi:hypothetical protein
MNVMLQKRGMINRNTNINDVINQIDEKQVHMEDGISTNIYHKKLEILQLSHVTMSLLSLFCSILYNESYHTRPGKPYEEVVLNLSI